MSKKITDKIKEILSAEDLKIFEGAIESMINDRVTNGVAEKTALLEDEIKSKYDQISEQYVAAKLTEETEKIKASLVASYDKKLAKLEETVVTQLDSFLDKVIVESVSDEMLEKIAINEATYPILEKIRGVLTESGVDLTQKQQPKADENVSKLEEQVKNVSAQLSESIAKNVVLQERLEKAGVFLLISEKTKGFTDSQTKKVINEFKDSSFEDAESKIDGFVSLIKESVAVAPKATPRVEKKKILESVGLPAKKTTVVESVEEIPAQRTMVDMASEYMY